MAAFPKHTFQRLRELSGLTSADHPTHLEKKIKKRRVANLARKAAQYFQHLLHERKLKRGLA